MACGVVASSVTHVIGPFPTPMYPVQPTKKIMPCTISIDRISGPRALDFVTGFRVAVCERSVTRTRTSPAHAAENVDSSGESRTTGPHERKKIEV
jgi:hypothetical protein